MTTDAAPVAAAGAAPPPAASDHQKPALTVTRLTARWVLLAVVTLVAFHKTLISLAQSTAAGSLNGFVWLIPVAAVVAAIGVTRRDRVELPIHDRQTDIIVGIVGLSFALMLQFILLQRYAAYFHLLRIDLAAMWLFVTASSTILFGLRPVVRFIWVWALLLLSFPLGYHLSVIFLGGNKASAGFAALFIAAVATAVAVGRTPSRAVLGGFGALLVGLPVLALMAAFTPSAPLLAFQMVPALLAMSLGGLSLFFYSRRGVPIRLLDRKIEPLAARQIWAGIPLVLASGVALSLVDMPASASKAVWEQGMTFGRALAAPAGWHQVEQSDYRWVRRVYGHDAILIRQRFVADVGNPEWDKLSRPRTVVVDAVSTARPFSLLTYPQVVLYDDSSSRVSDPRFIDLGHGVTGSLVTVVDDRRLVTYNLMSWTWRNADSAQRVTVAAVDNHEDETVFPEPRGGFNSSLRTMVSVFFRGNQATWDSDPTYKDAALLTSFGRGLVDAQIRNASPAP